MLAGTNFQLPRFITSKFSRLYKIQSLVRSNASGKLLLIQPQKIHFFGRFMFNLQTKNLFLK